MAAHKTPPKARKPAEIADRTAPAIVAATPKGKAMPGRIGTIPIVKIDRTTAQTMLPAMIHKGIFKDCSTLPKQEEIIAGEIKRRGGAPLSFVEKRELLAGVGRYISGDYVMHDYGDHAVGFSTKLYRERLNLEEKKLEEEKKSADLFPKGPGGRDSAIELQLEKIRLYRLGHELAILTLGAVYEQRTLENVVIYKRPTLLRLGYKTEDTQLYADLWNAFDSLRWVDFVFYDYRFSSTDKELSEGKGQLTGNFIYNLGEQRDCFILDVNPKWVGCVQHLLSQERTPKDKHRSIFGRRQYYDYPLAILPLARPYSTAAYLLTQFLVRERGNTRIKAQGFKVVMHRVERFIAEAHIGYDEPSKTFKAFIRAMREVEIIDHTEPSPEKLLEIPPSKRLVQQLRVYVKHPVKDLDGHIKGILWKRERPEELPLEEVPEK